MTFLLDTFDEASDTELSLHSPGTGGAWVKHTGTGSNAATARVLGGLGFADGATSGFSAYYYNSATPASADYSVSAIIIKEVLTADGGVGVFGRMSTTAVTGYYLYASTANINLYKVSNGTLTQVLTGPATEQNVQKTIELSMSGNQISAKVDGAHITGSPYTDPSPITEAGHAGIGVRPSARMLEVSAAMLSSGGASGTVSVTTSPAVASITGDTGTVGASGSIAVTTEPAGVTIVGTAGSASGNIRLTFGMQRERGGYAASLSSLKWCVFNANHTAVIASGTALTTDANGNAVIDVSGTSYAVGDYVPVLVLDYNAASAPQDRVVRTFFGFVPAQAQP